ncbi:MAG: hypothetical protein AB8H79_03965 [Myxococcota bacterium]
MQTAIHRLLGLCFFCVLALPLCGKIFEWDVAPRLVGVETPVKVPDFGWIGWHDGAISQWLNKRAELDLGMRKTFIRTENQINWKVFGTLNTHIFAGKDNVLFSANYSDGSDWCNEQVRQHIGRLTKTLATAQRALADHDIMMVPVVSANKSTFQRDALPPALARVAAIDVPTRVDVFRAAAEENDLHYLDGPRFLEDLKPRALAPAFAKGGVHWSNYAGAEVLLELLRQLKERSSKDFFDYAIVDTHWHNPPRPPDRDLAKLANIWTQPDLYEPAMDVTIGPVPGTGTVHPRVLFVGTSFCWNMTLRKGTESLGALEVYYYNKSRFIVEGETKTKVGPAPDPTAPDFLAKLAAFDLIVVEGNENSIIVMQYDKLFHALGAKKKRPKKPKRNGRGR